MESRAASGGGYSLRVFRRGVLPRLACNVLSLRCVSNHIGVRLLFVRRGDRYRLLGVGLRGAPCDAAMGEPQSGAGHGRVHGGRIGPHRVGMLRGAVPGVEGCGAACGGRWPGVAHPHVGRVLRLAQPHAGGAVPRHGHLRGRSGEVAVHGHVGAVSRVLLHRVAHRVPGVRAFEHDASAGA